MVLGVHAEHQSRNRLIDLVPQLRVHHVPVPSTIWGTVVVAEVRDILAQLLPLVQDVHLSPQVLQAVGGRSARQNPAPVEAVKLGLQILEPLGGIVLKHAGLVIDYQVPVVLEDGVLLKVSQRRLRIDAINSPFGHPPISYGLSVAVMVLDAFEVVPLLDLIGPDRIQGPDGGNEQHALDEPCIHKLLDGVQGDRRFTQAHIQQQPCVGLAQQELDRL